MFACKIFFIFDKFFQFVVTLNQGMKTWAGGELSLYMDSFIIFLVFAPKYPTAGEILLAS